MNRPLISICVPVYNGVAHLQQLLDALLASARGDFEIVMSDDCSSDGSWETLQRRAAGDGRLRCERNPDNLGMDRNCSPMSRHWRGANTSGSAVRTISSRGTAWRACSISWPRGPTSTSS